MLELTCIGNMTYQEAADLAGDVGTRIVIPGHWGMFEGNTANPYDFDAYIEAKNGERIRCKVPKAGEKIILKQRADVRHHKDGRSADTW